MLAEVAVARWHAGLIPAALFLALDAALVWRLARADGKRPAEWLGLMATQAIALWLVWPFVSGGRVGAGDAYYYGLQMADALTQFRNGVFPVLIGQTQFAFNGNMLVRMAPYYFHLGGLLDVLTGRGLSPFALSNLCVVASAIGGATSAYAAVRILAPEWRPGAMLLASLYVLSPGTGAVELIGFDLVATYMVLPWLPLFWLGMANSLQLLDDTQPLILSAGALALIWYAHPAIGLWLLPFFAGVQALRFLLVGCHRGNLRRPILAAAAFAWLIAYLLVSVQSLHLAFSLIAHYRDPLAIPRIIFGNLQAAWPGLWRPLEFPVGTLGNIQLGYALTGVFALCFATAWRRGLPGICLALMTLALLLLLAPVPELTVRIWSWIPRKFVDVSNVWPMQRFYPILGGIAVAWAAVTMRQWFSRPETRRRLLIGLGLCLAWSMLEAVKLRRHAAMVGHTTKESIRSLLPENITLTFSSYNMFSASYPPHFSHGASEPAFESRLLDVAMNPLEDNAGSLEAGRARLRVGTVSPGRPRPKPGERPAAQYTASFRTDGRSQYLLAFTFPSKMSGDLTLRGRELDRTYTMPEFGGALAFGAGPESARLLPLCLPPGDPDTITVASSMPRVSAEILAFTEQDLPIRTTSLTPLTVDLTTPQSGYLETPRMLVPGYEATVNGKAAVLIPSPAGFAAVAVPPGADHVVLFYPGPAVVRRAFWLSLAGFLALPFLALWAWLRAGRRPAAPFDGSAISAHSPVVRIFRYATGFRKIPS